MTTETAMAGLKIREADESDLPYVLRLYAEPGMDDGKVLDLSAARAVFESMNRLPDYHVYVVEQADCVIGSFALLIMPNLGHQGTPSGIMEDVVVKESCRGAGIGRAMVARAIDSCRARGRYELMLSSNLRRKGAHAFYERLGFERHGYSYRISPQRL